jgi:hypothetical protein
MKLSRDPFDDIFVVLPDYDLEPEVVEFALDDAEARETELQISAKLVLHLDATAIEDAIARVLRAVNYVQESTRPRAAGARAGALIGAAMNGRVGII